MVTPLCSQLMEGDTGLPYATQTINTVEPLFTVSLGVVTTIATREGSVCAHELTRIALPYNLISNTVGCKVQILIFR